MSEALTYGALLFIQTLAACLGVSIMTLYMYTRFKRVDMEREERYASLLRAAEQKSQDAIQTARKQIDETEAKTRARIDFLMERFNGSQPGAGTSDDTSADYQVLEILMSRYDEEELKALAFELGVRWESLAGDKAVTKALSLTQAARNQNKMRPLVSIIRRERPEAFRNS